VSEERLLCAREVGEMLGLSVKTVLTRFERGDLPGFRLYGRVGAPVRFRASEIKAAVAAWEAAAPGRGKRQPTSTGAAPGHYSPTLLFPSPANPAANCGRQDEED
jgi:predicted DNA-binding transcriptional regulator AlpA